MRHRAVVDQERVSFSGRDATFTEVPKPGEWIRRAGEDVPAGAIALRQGERFGVAHVGLASALGLVSVPVARRPRVTVACLGDELRRP
ncbi:MAG TPA: molybdopterin molybdenumtransferase MoeA, partial [Pseudomonadota bacterium]|nr:molybdopterin molybdenumtransferase MoeA [Pseudomonadota bacterium]